MQEKVLKVVYLFAGPDRRGSIKEYLYKFCPPGSKALVTEIDLLRSSDHDLLEITFQEKCLALVKDCHTVICTPPCNTFSRAPWSNRFGPQPIRSAKFPLGFPWLRDKLRKKADDANFLIEFTFRCLAAAIKKDRQPNEICICLTEHPEDLGIVDAADPASVPASLWRLPAFLELGLQTRALNQIDFGAPSVKPTRIGFNRGFESIGVPGEPSFDNLGRYIGPLPKKANPAGISLIRKSATEEGEFRTAAAAAYPPGLCQAIASAIWKAFHDFHSSAPLCEGERSDKEGAAPQEAPCLPSDDEMQESEPEEQSSLPSATFQDSQKTPALEPSWTDNSRRQVSRRRMRWKTSPPPGQSGGGSDLLSKPGDLMKGDLFVMEEASAPRVAGRRRSGFFHRRRRASLPSWTALLRNSKGTLQRSVH